MSILQAGRQKAKGKLKKAKIRRRTSGLFCRPLLPFAFCPLPFAFILKLHISHLTWPEAAQKLGRLLAVVERIARFDEEEELVARGEREVRHVEDRMIRFGQPIEREHAEDACERRTQDRRLERNRD